MTPQDQHIRVLLQRWIAGDITAREEVELRSAAKTDPFLAEALSGYEQTPAVDHVDQLGQLRAKLKQGRDSRSAVPPARAVRPMRSWWAIAATVVLLILAGTAVWLFPIGQDKMTTMAESTAPAATEAVPETSTAPPTETTEEKSSTAPQVAASPPTRPPAREETSATPAAPITSDFSEDAAPELADAVKLEALEPEEAVDQPVADLTLESEPVPITDEALPPPPPPPPPPSVIPEEKAIATAPVNASQATGRSKVDLSPAVTNSAVPVPRAGDRLIQGVVMDQYGDPLIGANIQVSGTAAGVVTNLDGSFEFTITDAKNVNLIVSYTGFETQTVPIRTGNQRLTITLSEGEALSEVVVTGLGTRRESYQPPAPTVVQPQDGFRALRDYLRANTPEGTPKGRVKVRFQLNTTGKPYQLEVVRSSDSRLEPLALRLLTTGPNWQIIEGEAPVEVTYVVKFR